jgi:hypothetical protein
MAFTIGLNLYLFLFILYKIDRKFIWLEYYFVKYIIQMPNYPDDVIFEIVRQIYKPKVFYNFALSCKQFAEACRKFINENEGIPIRFSRVVRFPPWSDYGYRHILPNGNDNGIGRAKYTYDCQEYEKYSNDKFIYSHSKSTAYRSDETRFNFVNDRRDEYYIIAFSNKFHRYGFNLHPKGSKVSEIHITVNKNRNENEIPDFEIRFGKHVFEYGYGIRTRYNSPFHNNACKKTMKRDIHSNYRVHIMRCECEENELGCVHREYHIR